jgi:hypothetical protein
MCREKASWRKVQNSGLTETPVRELDETASRLSHSSYPQSTDRRPEVADKSDIEKEASEGLARQHIRPAGPENMKDPPEDWDVADEQSDESFPASDPPANY